MTLELLQQDLRDGMSIEDACTKYGVSFKYVVANMPRPFKPRGKRKPKRAKTYTGEKYIQHRDGHYSLRKNIKGRMMFFGTYSSLEDAMKVRDYCIVHGWKQRSIDKYCERLGVERVKAPNCRVRYS